MLLAIADKAFSLRLFSGVFQQETHAKMARQKLNTLSRSAFWHALPSVIFSVLATPLLSAFHLNKKGGLATVVALRSQLSSDVKK